jgi:hypothetical protein
VKRSGRNKPMWVAIHKCMEATLGISLYSYLYLKPAKMLCLYYLLWSREKNRHNMFYPQESKCKNHKIKGEKEIKEENG